MCMHEQWRPHCTSQCGGVNANKWACVLCARRIQNDWVEQWTCTKFCIKLEYSSVETIRVIQKATAMGNWWLAASSQQCTHSCIMSHAEVFGETSNHSDVSVLLWPIFGALRLLAFPKTKITFEREEISDHRWDLEEYDRADEGDWENCARSQGAYFEGDWGIIVLCTMFLVSSSVNVSMFHIIWLDTFWTDLVYDLFPRVSLLDPVELPALCQIRVVIMDRYLCLLSNLRARRSKLLLALSFALFCFGLPMMVFLNC